MPKIYTDASHSFISYCIDGGGSGCQRLPAGYTDIEAEYLAIQYGLNEFFLKWNKELDARAYNYSGQHSEDDGWYKTGGPANETPRSLPPPILIVSSNEAVVRQLSQQGQTGSNMYKKLVQTIWKQTENLEVKFEWVSKKQNLAVEILN